MVRNHERNEEPKHEQNEGPKHEQNEGEQNETARLDDNLVLLSIDDGKVGHYVTLAMPTFDGSPEALTAFAVGIKYDALRKGQSVAKKAAKAGTDAGAALAEFASTFKPEADAERVETIGTKRAEIAGDMLKARLVEKGVAGTDANVAANLPAYMAKYDAKIESALRTFIAAGYTPKRKGEGEAVGTTATGFVVDDL